MLGVGLGDTEPVQGCIKVHLLGLKKGILTRLLLGTSIFYTGVTFISKLLVIY